LANRTDVDAVFGASGLCGFPFFTFSPAGAMDLPPVGGVRLTPTGDGL
jgi:hypothetical protein